jgi:hypothetical protein
MLGADSVQRLSALSRPADAESPLRFNAAGTSRHRPMILSHRHPFFFIKTTKTVGTCVEAAPGHEC